MTLLADKVTTYGERRDRARELGARLDFADQPLRLYLALVDAQERAFERALATPPAADELAAFVVRDALPGIMEATVAAGPERLQEAVLLRFHDGDLEASSKPGSSARTRAAPTHSSRVRARRRSWRRYRISPRRFGRMTPMSGTARAAAACRSSRCSLRPERPS